VLLAQCKLLAELRAKALGVGLHFLGVLHLLAQAEPSH